MNGVEVKNSRKESCWRGFFLIEKCYSVRSWSIAVVPLFFGPWTPRRQYWWKLYRETDGRTRGVTRKRNDKLPSGSFAR